MIEGQVSIFDFNILSGEEKHIKVPYKQMVIILEALENFKKDIESFEPDNVVNKMRFKDKLEEVNYLIEVIETGAKYNFHKRMERCKSRKEKQDDAGMDALSAAVVLKENKKEDKNDR